jgi:hypothetical protein
MREHSNDQFADESEFDHRKIFYPIYVGSTRRNKAFQYLAGYQKWTDYILGCDLGQASLVRQIKSDLSEQTA